MTQIVRFSGVEYQPKRQAVTEKSVPVAGFQPEPIPKTLLPAFSAAQWQGMLRFSGTNAVSSAESALFDKVFNGNAPLTWQKIKEIDGGSLGKLQVYAFSDPTRPDAKPHQFYALQQPGMDLVTLGSTVPHGSADEDDPAIWGFFHFLEHLFFKGSANGKGEVVWKPGDFDRFVARTYADINAWTGKDQTVYPIMTSPAEHAQSNLRRHAIFIQDPALVPQDVDSERKTVVNELQQANNKLDQRLYSQASRDLFGDHPYGHDVLGTEEAVLTMPVERMRQLYNQFYGQSHRKLIMVGDFDLGETLQNISTSFNVAPERYEEDYQPPQRPQPPQRSEAIRRTFYDKAYPVDNGRIQWVFRGPEANNIKEYLAWEFVDILTTGSDISYGVQEIVNRDEKALSLGSHYAPQKDGSLLTVEAQARLENLDEVERRITEIHDRVKQGKVPAEDFEMARNFLIKQHADSLEDQMAVFNHITRLVNNGLEDQLFGDNYKKMLATITLEDVQAVAQKYLVPGRKVEYRVLSEKHKPQAEAAPIKFGGRLEKGENATQLSGGAELIVDNRPGRTKTAITIAVPGGNRVAKHPGEIRLLAHLLNRSNRTHSPNELSKYGVNNRLDFKVRGDNDQILVEVSGEPEKIREMVALLRDTLLAPTFPQKDVERQKDVLVAGYEDRAAGTPGMLAEIAHLESFYPPGHPYGQKIVGNPSINGPSGLLFTRKAVEKSRDAVTPDRLRQLHHRIFQPRNLTISVVGKVDGVAGFDFAHEMDQFMKDLQGTRKPTRIKQKPAATPVLAEDTFDVRIKEGELAHTQIIRSWPTLGLKDKDRAAMALLQGILYTVGMSSRLFQTFREGPHGGLCYHTHGRNLADMEGGRFKWYIGIEHKNLPLVLDLIDQEIEKVQYPEKTGKTREALEEELELVKGTLKHQFRVALTSAEEKSAATAVHRALGVPSSPEVFEQFDNITLDDVSAVARKYFSRPALTTILTTADAAEQFGFPPNARITKAEWQSHRLRA